MMHFPFSFLSLPSQTRNLFSSLLSFKFSALAAPLRRSSSTLVLAALSAAVAGAQPADDWIIETVAGGSSYRGDGGAATAAQLRFPAGVALDGAGNLYIADRDNHRIRKVDPAGVISTVAGDGMRGYGGDGGAATAAQLFAPRGVALDGAGNLYIADTFNQRIRKVDAAGVISTVAGDGTRGYGGDGGPAVDAQLNTPYGLALDGAGNLYIADLFNHRIRKVDTAGMISTVAGDGTRGSGGDGDPATSAQLNFPRGVAPDGAGNLYIADDLNHRIRKVDAAGVISTVAGSGNGRLRRGRLRRGRRPGCGGATEHPPPAWRWTGSGNLYIADTNNHRIRKVDPAGVISTVAGRRDARLRRGRRPGCGRATELAPWRGGGRSGQPVHRRRRQRPHPQGGRLRGDLHGRGRRTGRGRRRGCCGATVLPPPAWRRTEPATCTSPMRTTTASARWTPRG